MIRSYQCVHDNSWARTFEPDQYVDVVRKALELRSQIVVTVPRLTHVYHSITSAEHRLYNESVRRTPSDFSTFARSELMP